MPNMLDSARNGTLTDWAVKTKKQVVKLHAVVKWSRKYNPEMHSTSSYYDDWLLSWRGVFS